MHLCMKTRKKYQELHKNLYKVSTSSHTKSLHKDISLGTGYLTLGHSFFIYTCRQELLYQNNSCNLPHLPFKTSFPSVTLSVNTIHYGSHILIEVLFWNKLNLFGKSPFEI